MSLGDPAAFIATHFTMYLHNVGRRFARIMVAEAHCIIVISSPCSRPLSRVLPRGNKDSVHCINQPHTAPTYILHNIPTTNQIIDRRNTSTSKSNTMAPRKTRIVRLAPSPIAEERGETAPKPIIYRCCVDPPKKPKDMTPAEREQAAKLAKRERRKRANERKRNMRTTKHVADEEVARQRRMSRKEYGYYKEASMADVAVGRMRGEVLEKEREKEKGRVEKRFGRGWPVGRRGVCGRGKAASGKKEVSLFASRRTIGEERWWIGELES